MQKLSKINTDLQEERNKVQFNIEEFTNWFYSGKENVEKKRFLGEKFEICGSKFHSSFLSLAEDFFMSDPELQDETPVSYLSHKELYEDSIKKSTVLLKKLKQLEVQGRSYDDLNR
jgi:acyl-CoA oxidase